MRLSSRRAPSAERDLEDVHSYVAADNPVAARDFLIRFKRMTALLASRPHIGPPVLLPARKELRKMSLAPYIVFYRVAEMRIEIVRILHSARDLEAAALFDP